MAVYAINHDPFPLENKLFACSM